MKKFVMLALVAVGMVAAAGSAFAFDWHVNNDGNASSQSTSASANIDRSTAIGLAKNQDLDFGTLKFPQVAGTVVIDPTKTDSLSQSVSTGLAADSSDSSYQPARYTVTGDANSLFTITLPATACTLTATNNDNFAGSAVQMSVDTWKCSMLTSSQMIKNEAGGPGLDSQTCAFAVGATLHVAKYQPSGAYSGTFNVSVAYN